MALTANKAIITNGAPVNGIQHMKDSLLEIDDDGSVTSPAEVLSVNLPRPTVFFNDTGVEIPACSWINGGPGIDAGTGNIKGFLADASIPPLSSSVIGITTVATPDGQSGIAYDGASVACDATGLTIGVPLYLSATTPGAGTTTRPQYPDTIVILGTIQVTGASGSVLASVQRFTRDVLSRDYTFTSRGITAGTYYLAGFYDYAATSITLTQASTTQTYGDANVSYAAHAGICASAAGTVDTGQVGLRVTGTLDSETGAQTATQTQTITDDITTLTANQYAETTGKFSGTVTFELYVVSGSPTTYSLTFNYGYSKYEDFFNTDFTINAVEAVWQGGATDASGFNIEVLHHKVTGWTYAASGFVPGDGAIAERTTDQQIDQGVISGDSGAWKHLDLETFVDGGGVEGVIVRVTTGANNTIQILNLNLSVFSEELT
jgi:hypothetical protein